MKLKTTFEKWWSKHIQIPSISLNNKRAGVNIECPFCKRVGKIIVIVFHMAEGKRVFFRGRKRCKIVRCSNCEHGLIVSLDCLGAECGNKVKCIQYGIVTADVEHLKE